MALLSALSGMSAGPNAFNAGGLALPSPPPQTRPVPGGPAVPIIDPAVLARMSGIPAGSPVQLSPNLNQPMQLPQAAMPAAPRESQSTGALSAMATPPKQHGPKFFDQGGIGDRLLDAIGAALNPAGFFADRAQGRAFQRRSAFEQQKLDEQRAYEKSVKNDDRQYQQNLPQYFNAGSDRVRFDPVTNQSTMVYDAPEDFQTYAGGFGAENTPEYRTAAQDFVLKGNGPTAFGYDVDLENERQGNRTELEDVRNSNRAALRQTPTFAQSHPRSAGPRAVTPSAVMGGIISRFASGGTLAPNERALLDRWNTGARGRGSAALPGGIPSTPSSRRPTLSLPTQKGGKVMNVRTPQEAMALPKGTVFRTPDGKTKVRP